MPHPVRLVSTALVLVLACCPAGLAQGTAQQAYLKASNAAAFDQFGLSVAASGDTVVVGARFESSSASGVNGDQGNDGSPGSGAAYVFVRDGSSWTQQAYLKASVNTPSAQFGSSVAIDGDTLVVGANHDPHGAGEAFVFVRSAGTWTEQARLTASNTTPEAGFGVSVSISGDTLVVGADWADGAQFASGAAYVFVRNGSTWTEQASLTAFNGQSLDLFGHSVSVSGDLVVVGAPWEASQASGVNGDSADNTSLYAGAAYVFARSGTLWFHQAYLKPSLTTPGVEFGTSVSASGGTVVVGAPRQSGNATGIDGDETLSSSTAGSGAAYVFVIDGSAWSQQAYVKASNTGKADAFGASLALSGDTLVVAAPGESSRAVGVNGDESDDGAPDSGAAYVFDRSGTAWTQRAYLKPSNTGAGDGFGGAAALSGDTLVIGAQREASSASGVNGHQDDDSAPYSGAAYAFGLGPAGPWTNMGFSLQGISGIPGLVGSGPLAAGSSNAVELANAALSALAALFVALSGAPVPFKGGTLLPLPAVLLPVLRTSAAGGISLPFTMPAGVPAGTELWLQWAIVDASAVQGFALSSAIRGLTP